MSDINSKILSTIENYVSGGVLSMHMPGHKRNTELFPYLKKLGAEYDITEICGFDNLHDPEGIIRDSMQRASKLWGSRKAFFLVNGSTCGILAAFCSVVGSGEKVLVARNCHMSVYNAIEICQAEPVFVFPPFDEEIGIYKSILPSDIENALELNPEIKLIVITSPTYEGVTSDIFSICKAAHSRGILVLVDEAHGAHLGFSDFFPGGAVKAGADIVIQSLHKTLPSLTQTAIAHLNGDLVNEEEFGRRLSVFETSSPSYLLLSSIDGCVGLLESKGNELFEKWESSISAFEEKVRALNKLEVFMRQDCGLHKKENYYGYDWSKILITTRKTSMTGSELMSVLREKYKIELEMYSGAFVLAMTGSGDKKESLLRFGDALLEIDYSCRKEESDRKTPLKTEIPRQIYSVCKALRSDKKLVETRFAYGRISAEYVWAYPPGVPLLIPGEEISETFISSLKDYLAFGIRLKSSSGAAPESLRVVV